MRVSTLPLDEFFANLRWRKIRIPKQSQRFLYKRQAGIIFNLAVDIMHKAKRENKHQNRIESAKPGECREEFYGLVLKFFFLKFRPCVYVSKYLYAHTLHGLFVWWISTRHSLHISIYICPFTRKRIYKSQFSRSINLLIYFSRVQEQQQKIHPLMQILARIK